MDPTPLSAIFQLPSIDNKLLPARQMTELSVLTSALLCQSLEPIVYCDCILASVYPQGLENQANILRDARPFSCQMPDSVP